MDGKGSTRTRRAVLRATGPLLAVGIAGCLGIGGNSGSKEQSIGMTDDFAFDPKTARISGETTVVWENSSDTNHTVTAYENQLPEGAAYFASGDFSSEQAARENGNQGLIRPDERYEHTFEQPGRYGYFCLPHESSKMVGEIVVE